MSKKWTDFSKKLDFEAKKVLGLSGIDFKSLGSDDERIDSALSALSKSDIWRYARYDDLRKDFARRQRSTKEGDKFGLENAAKIIDTWENKKSVDGKKTITPGDQFYDAYWTADQKTRKFWKDAIEGKLGAGAWDEVKKRVNEQLKARSTAEAEKNRRDIIEGKAEGQGMTDWLASAVGRLLVGRVKDKALAGKAIEPKDVALDVAEDIAMTLPFSAATKLRKLGLAAAVPLGSEILDDIAYSVPKPDKEGNFNPEDLKNMNPNDLPERADFNFADVAVGTLTNLAAPIIMNRTANKVLNLFGKGGKGMDPELKKTVKGLADQGKWDALNKEHTDFLLDKRNEYATDLEHEALLPFKKEAGFITDENELIKKVTQIEAAHKGIEMAEKSGNQKLKKVFEDQAKEAIGDDKVLAKAYRETEAERGIGTGLYDDELEGSAMAFDEAFEDLVNPNYYKMETSGIVRRQLNNRQPYTESQFEQLRKADDLKKSVSDFLKLEEVTEKKISDKLAPKEFKAAKAAYSKDPSPENAVQLMKMEDKYGQTGVDYDIVFPKLLKAMPDIFTRGEKMAAGLNIESPDVFRRVYHSDPSIMDWLDVTKPGMTKFLRGIAEPAEAFTVNKLGNQRNAERTIAPVEAAIGSPGILTKAAKKMQTESKDMSRRSQTQAVLSVLADQAESPEDKKWLGIIAKNPDVVKGAGAEAYNPDFRRWMLVRGSDILRGTELYRPTFEVE